jgi:hypothetical protein
MADIVDRLIPFAFNYEPDYTEEYLEKGMHLISVEINFTF